MPEGDTIFRAAAKLSRALVGKQVVRFASPLASLANAKIAGARVVAVDAIGKNLLMRFDDGRTLHSHMKMNGVWLVRPKNRPIRASMNDVRAIVEVDDCIATCLRAPVMRLLRPGAEVSDKMIATLGPDLLAPDFDPAEARLRLRAFARDPIAAAVLQQSAVAGIGNIYKSESLFAARVDPFAKVADLTDEEIDRVLIRARALMRPNAVRAGTRTTRGRIGGPAYWVYMRAGQHCLVCGEAIRVDREKTDRKTYYCPSCQRSAHA